jgi:hypothetical protein
MGGRGGEGEGRGCSRRGASRAPGRPSDGGPLLCRRSGGSGSNAGGAPGFAPHPTSSVPSSSSPSSSLRARSASSASTSGADVPCTWWFGTGKEGVGTGAPAVAGARPPRARGDPRSRVGCICADPAAAAAAAAQGRTHLGRRVVGGAAIVAPGRVRRGGCRRARALRLCPPSRRALRRRAGRVAGGVATAAGGHRRRGGTPRGAGGAGGAAGRGGASGAGAGAARLLLGPGDAGAGAGRVRSCCTGRAGRAGEGVGRSDLVHERGWGAGRGCLKRCTVSRDSSTPGRGRYKGRRRPPRADGCRRCSAAAGRARVGARPGGAAPCVVCRSAP